MRHEKVLIVVLSYVIGFTTAYIAFGITQEDTFKTYTPPAIVKANSSGTHEQVPPDPEVKVVFTDDGMFVEHDGRRQIISGKLRPNILEGPGFHVAIPEYAVSPNGEFVYFCEQQTTESNRCHDYVYVVDEHIVKPLTIDSSSLTSSVVQTQFFWQSDGTARYNGYRSRSPQRPWELIDTE